MRFALPATAGSILLAALLVMPAAQAWSVARVAPPDPPVAAWTTDLVPAAFPTDALATAMGAVACPLGDVTGDGVADLAVLVQAAGGRATVEARAGPGFQDVAWRVATRLDRVLQCAPDLDLDGTLDPIVRTIADEAAGAAATGGAAVDEAHHVIQQTLSGASGAALVGRVDPESATGVAAGGLQAAQNATALLLPAAEGALALLKGSASGAALPLPLPESLPLGQLQVAASQAASLQVLDATGAVVGTIKVDQAGVQPLALAPVQLSGALPDVAVLSQVADPVAQAAAGVPQLALYAADGTLAWSAQLPATAGVPMLIPNAGDLDLDGVGDLIVTTVEQPLQAAPGAAYTVLSGVDGQVLFDSGSAVTGLLSALPLGDLGAGPALLQATMAAGASQLQLSALGGAGQVLWSASVDGLARPVNAVLDPYTHDLLGFTDLTGDGLPDVAVATALSSGGLAVQALDGVDGSVAWAATLPAADTLVPVVIGAAQAVQDAGKQAVQGLDVNASTEVATLPGLAGMADGVADAAVGKASLLLAIGQDQGEATLSLLQATTGKVLWNATATLPDVPLSDLTATVAGDLTGDKVQDLLVTAKVAAGQASAAAGADTSGVVAVVSGATGRTAWTNATGPAAGAARLDFASTLGPASAEASKASDGTPAPGAWATGLALAAAVALVRRRRQS